MPDGNDPTGSFMRLLSRYRFENVLEIEVKIDKMAFPYDRDLLGFLTLSVIK